MDLFARRYTVLMGNEPLTLWLKNGKVKRAEFMEKQVPLKLSADTIKQIRSYPAKVINGNNLSDNVNFTSNVAKMMSDQLRLAIAKKDKKIMGRFARSELVPENMKQDFEQAINRRGGLRGMLFRAMNNTNAIFQNLAKKIDRFFDKVNDKISNQKLDKYLQEYQLKEFNKAPPLPRDYSRIHQDPKLMDLALDFVEKNQKSWDEINSLKLYDEAYPPHQKKLNEFMTQAAQRGFTSGDAKIAFFQTIEQKELNRRYLNEYRCGEDLWIETGKYLDRIEDLKSKLLVFEKQAASKNETIEDYVTLSKGVNVNDRIDLLLENQAYQDASESEKILIEEKHLHEPESINERLEEILGAQEALKNPTAEKEMIYRRDPVMNFSTPQTRFEVEKTWKQLQKINQQKQAQNRDFMNVSAVKFNGVSKTSLKNWASVAKENKVDPKIVEKFVSATLRNAVELQKAGILKEQQPGEFKFVDQFAKETLYKNLDKPVTQIAEQNKGEYISTLQADPKEEIKERIGQITNDKSFENLLDQNGNLDATKLHEYAKKIETIATQLQTQTKAVTKEDLQTANQTVQHTVERQRA